MVAVMGDIIWTVQNEVSAVCTLATFVQSVANLQTSKSVRIHTQTN